jgi:hypothetical protein
MVRINIRHLESRAFGGDVTWGHISAEIREVLEARSWAEVREEVSDVLCNAQVWFFQRTGRKFDWPMLVGDYAAKKFLDRIAVWEGIFASEGLVFHLRYLRKGSNYARPEKVARILEEARQDQLHS